jgi:hypothetical protein
VAGEAQERDRQGSIEDQQEPCEPPDRLSYQHARRVTHLNVLEPASVTVNFLPRQQSPEYADKFPRYNRFMSLRASLLGILVAVVACGRTPAKRHAAVGSAAAPSARAAQRSAPTQLPATPALVDPSQSPDFGPPGLPEFQPAVPAHVLGMMDHSDSFGWLADGSEVGYCMVGGGSGGTLCEFFAPSGKRTGKLDDFNENWEPDPKRTLLVQKRIGRYSVPRVAWVFAGDVVLTWHTSPGGNGDGVARLQVGARVRNGAADAFPISIVGGQNDFEVHLEAWGFSPDASLLAVLGHSFAGEFADGFQVRVVSAAHLAEEAYNAAGFALHKRGDYAAAAPLFHKAAYAEPAAKLPMYNLACALSRLRDRGAAKALELAIARGGPEVVSKAKRDSDFDSVRAEPWFVALTQ